MGQDTQLWAPLSLELFSCLAALTLGQDTEERGNLGMSTQPGLMCLDKALHMTDRFRETGVLMISRPWTAGTGLSSGTHLLPFGFCVTSALKLFYLDSYQLLVCSAFHAAWLFFL